MRPPPVPVEARRKIAAEYAAGSSARELQARHGYSVKNVLAWVREAGETVRPSKSRPGHSAEKKALAVAEYLAGEAGDTIAPRYGVKAVTILEWVRQAGHQARTRRENRKPPTLFARPCAVCGTSITRKQFTHPPERTACGAPCRRALPRLRQRGPTETALAAYCSFTTAQRLLTVDRSTLAEALRQDRLPGAFRWEGHWIIPKAGVAEYDRRRRERFPHLFPAD